MKYYYIPTNSLNINAILSSESISPISFYSKRKFGHRIAFKYGENYPESFLPLFSDYTDIQSVINEPDQFLVYIKVPENILKSDRIKKWAEGSIYAKTIYLTKDCEFIFKSEFEKRKILSRTFSALEVKLVNKYESNFKVEKWQPTKSISFEELNNKPSPQDIEDAEIFEDRRVNTFKGFVYGYSISKAFAKSPEELKAIQAINTVQNLWGGLKSEYSSNYKVSYSFKEKRRRSEEYTLFQPVRVNSDLILEAIKKLKNIYEETSLNTREHILADFLKNKGISLSEIEAFINTSNKINENIIESLYEKCGANNGFYSLYYRLLDSISALIEDIRFYNVEKLDKEVKDSIHGLFRLFEEEFTKDKVYYLPNFDTLKFSLNEVDFKDGFEELSKDDLVIFKLILNLIISFETTETFTDVNKLELLQALGKQVTELFGENSIYRKDLLCVYDYIGNKTATIPEAKSVVIRNLFPFLLKADSIESFSSYQYAKGVEKPHLGFSMWCMLHGYSSLSKLFTKRLYISKDQLLTGALDKYFLSVIKSI